MRNISKYLTIQVNTKNTMRTAVNCISCITGVNGERGNEREAERALKGKPGEGELTLSLIAAGARKPSCKS